MGNKIPLTVEEKQEILFDILKDIDSFCRDNDIKYSISDGTMLGAIRHDGFIPWDDDADICMLREDFDKFVASYKSPKYHMLFRTMADDEYLLAGFIKINDPQTYSGNLKKIRPSRYGVSVDIFPFENVPEDEMERKDYMHRLRSIDNRIYHSQKSDILSRIKSRKLDTKGWLNLQDSLVHEGNYKDSPFVGQSICVKDDHVVLPKVLFDDIIDIPFNGYNLKGFADYHKYLSIVFGDDYMTPKKWAHEDIVYRK